MSASYPSSASAEALGIFPLVQCATCAQESLAHGELREEEVVYVCLSCGDPGPLVRSADDAALSRRGLELAGRATIEPESPKQTGCSKTCGRSRALGRKASIGSSHAGCTPCSTSKSGGCGSGSC